LSDQSNTTTTEEDPQPSGWQQSLPTSQQPSSDQPPASSTSSGDVVLVAVFPVSTFNSGVEGVDTITSSGTLVPADKVEDVQNAAYQAHVTLKEIR
jgi:hypothetical protein